MESDGIWLVGLPKQVMTRLLMFLTPQSFTMLSNLIFPSNTTAIQKWQRSSSMVRSAQVAGSELRSCSARGAALHMPHAAAGSGGRCGSESKHTWRGGSYVWSCWYSNALNHPPFITIFMGGINHQTWMVYHCYAHLT